MSQKPLTPRQRVLKKYPDAWCMPHGLDWAVFSRKGKFGFAFLGAASGRNKAWRKAASAR